MHKQGRDPQMQIVLSDWSMFLCKAVAPGVITEDWLSGPMGVAEEVSGTDIETSEDREDAAFFRLRKSIRRLLSLSIEEGLFFLVLTGPEAGDSLISFRSSEKLKSPQVTLNVKAEPWLQSILVISKHLIPMAGISFSSLVGAIVVVWKCYRELSSGSMLLSQLRAWSRAESN